LTGRLCHACDAKELSRLVMEAARRLIGGDHVAVYLRDNGPGYINSATNSDVSRKLKTGLAPILDKVTSSAKAEIMDNLDVDPRFNENSAGALACAHLACHGIAHGALVLLSANARAYA
ncbi:GAF domain-containing protein, partial [Oceanidesulfovibrio marinus]